MQPFATLKATLQSRRNAPREVTTSPVQAQGGSCTADRQDAHHEDLEEGEIYEGPPKPLTADALQKLFPSKSKKRGTSKEDTVQSDTPSQPPRRPWSRPRASEPRSRPTTEAPKPAHTHAPHSSASNSSRSRSANPRFTPSSARTSRPNARGRHSRSRNIQSFRLIHRFRERTATAGLRSSINRDDINSHRTAVRLCSGDLDEVAYDNIYWLFERYTCTQIVDMINMSREPRDAIHCRVASARLKQAIRVLSRDADENPEDMLARLNVCRLGRDLVPVVVKNWERDSV